MKREDSVDRKNFIWNTLGITCNAFTSLFFLILLNRINGIKEAGIFSYTFSVCCLFYVIALYYNRTFQISDVECEYTNNQYITNRLLTSCITLLLCVFFALLNQFDGYKMTVLIALMIYKILDAISDCFHGCIQKKDQLYFVGESLFFKAILGILGFACLDYLFKNVIVAIGFLILVNAIGLLIEIKKYQSLFNEKYKVSLEKSLDILKKTLPLFIFSFLTIYLCNCQKYVLEYYMDENFQTILGIIIMPATMLSLCGQYLISPSLNELSINYSKNKLAEFKNKLFKINRIFLFLGIVVLIIAYFLGIPVLNIVYSINLTEYKTAFLIIILGAIFYAFSTIFSSCLTLMKKNQEQLYIFILSSCIATIISCLFIKSNGINGAAYAYAIAMFLHFLLTTLLLKKYLEEKR